MSLILFFTADRSPDSSGSLVDPEIDSRWNSLWSSPNFNIPILKLLNRAQLQLRNVSGSPAEVKGPERDTRWRMYLNFQFYPISTTTCQVFIFPTTNYAIYVSQSFVQPISALPERNFCMAWPIPL
jgi:hypothetical protein